MKTLWLGMGLTAVGLLAACGATAATESQPQTKPTAADATDGAECPQYQYPLAEPAYNAKRLRDLSAFGAALAGLTDTRRGELDAMLLEAGLPQIAGYLDSGRLTSVDVVTYYIDRIARFDVGRLNAVLEVNPAALDSAAALDAERATAGPRGRLHGIPVLIKDNISTGDGLHTTAGAFALRDWRPEADAFLVARLRDAGAVILGKTNLSEWANYVDPCLPNGFSALGGQTQSPYGPFDPSGSSTGSAVAVAANLAPVSIGSETQGSITWPARVNSLAGLKTSLGLVSRSGIVPLVDWMDVPGPFARSVTDLAIVLTAIAAPGPEGIDAADPATAAASPLAGRDFTAYLAPELARRVRVGVIHITEADVSATLAARAAGLGRPLTDREEAEVREMVVDLGAADIAAALRSQGVTVVDLPFEAAKLTDAPPLANLLPYGFRDSFDRFMAGLGERAPVSSLAEVAGINAVDRANRVPYGDRYVSGAAATAMTAAEYEALSEANRTSAQDGLRSLFHRYQVDVVTGYVGQAFAAAGFPALVVPNGAADDGHPLGAMFVGDFLSEPQLLAVGRAFERARDGRVVPNLEAVLPTLP